MRDLRELHDFTIRTWDSGDGRHREVELESSAVVLSDDDWFFTADGSPIDDRTFVLARRRAAGIVARIAVAVLPELSAARGRHGCGPSGLVWYYDADLGCYGGDDGCGFSTMETLRPAGSGGGDTGESVGLYLTVPADQVDEWMTRLRDLLAEVAADDAHIPAPGETYAADSHDARVGVRTPGTEADEPHGRVRVHTWGAGVRYLACPDAHDPVPSRFFLEPQRAKTPEDAHELHIHTRR